MIRCSIELRDRVFVAGYGFSSFARKFGKNLGKNTILVNTIHVC